ncbi:hypothetical protein GCM10027431_21440 [Lysobacter rhizosphaerae]
MQQRTLAVAVLCAVMATAFAQPAVTEGGKQQETAVDAATEAAEPSATLEVESEKTRMLMGGTSGKGVLHFQGTDYPFTYKSASAGVGAKLVNKVTASGKVYSLSRVEDFAGKYTSLTKTAMAGSSEVTASYKNDKGVTMVLQGKAEGVGLSYGGGMVTVTLEPAK